MHFNCCAIFNNNFIIKFSTKSAGKIISKNHPEYDEVMGWNKFLMISHKQENLTTEIHFNKVSEFVTELSFFL